MNTQKLKKGFSVILAISIMFISLPVSAFASHSVMPSTSTRFTITAAEDTIIMLDSNTGTTRTVGAFDSRTLTIEADTSVIDDISRRYKHQYLSSDENIHFMVFDNVQMAMDAYDALISDTTITDVAPYIDVSRMIDIGQEVTFYDSYGNIIIRAIYEGRYKRWTITYDNQQLYESEHNLSLNSPTTVGVFWKIPLGVTILWNIFRTAKRVSDKLPDSRPPDIIAPVVPIDTSHIESIGMGSITIIPIAGYNEYAISKSRDAEINSLVWQTNRTFYNLEDSSYYVFARSNAGDCIILEVPRTGWNLTFNLNIINPAGGTFRLRLAHNRIWQNVRILDLTSRGNKWFSVTMNSPWLLDGVALEWEVGTIRRMEFDAASISVYSSSNREILRYNWRSFTGQSCDCICSRGRAVRANVTSNRMNQGATTRIVTHHGYFLKPQPSLSDNISNTDIQESIQNKAPEEIFIPQTLTSENISITNFQETPQHSQEANVSNQWVWVDSGYWEDNWIWMNEPVWINNWIWAQGHWLDSGYWADNWVLSNNLVWINQGYWHEAGTAHPIYGDSIEVGSPWQPIYSKPIEVIPFP
jgi:hypothetical protein